MTNDEDEHAEGPRSVLETLSARTGQAPKILLRDEDSDLGKAPVIDASARTSLQPGDGSPHYQVLGKIAEGGMGAVFKSHDSDLGRDVAMKVLLERHADKPAVLQRFIEEAQIGGQLQHPGIVPVYELGLLEDQRPFFTMKLVKGRTLAALFAERRGDPGERRRFLKIFEQVCETMAYAHSRRVVHRDLKPANIMVGAFGEVQVVDWGLGKVLTDGGVADERAAERALTDVSIIETLRSSGSSQGTDSLVGSVMGTPMYMSPEQARGDVDRLDERTDVFGLGAILCEVLTGKPPYVGEADAVLVEAARALQDGARERLAACGADAFLVDLVERCLAPNPAVRPRSAGALVEELGGWLADQEQRARDAEVARARAEEERKARRLTLALASTIVAALLAGGWLWQSQQREAVARREALLADVDARLAEAQLARGGGELVPALSHVDAAQALVDASRDADDALVARVEQLGDTLRAEIAAAQAEAARQEHLDAFLAALEASLDESDLNANDTFDTELLSRMEAIFADIGVDIDGDLQAQAAKLRELERDELLGQAVDQWARYALQGRGYGQAFQRRLDLAVLVDPDPDRAVVRRALRDDDRRAIQRLAALTDVPDAFNPVTGITFADSVKALGHGDIEMRPLLRTIASRHPSHAQLHARIAMLDLWEAPDETQDPVRGLYHASISYAARPDEQLARLHMARALAMNGLGVEAVELAVEAIRSDPDNHFAGPGVGGMFILRALRPDDARRERMAIHETYAELGQETPQLLNLWAWDLVNLPDPTPDEVVRARDLALRSMELSTETSDNWNTVAAAFWMLDDPERALLAAERSIELSEGGYATDHALRALALQSLGREDEARAAVRSIADGMPPTDPLELELVAEAEALFGGS